MITCGQARKSAPGHPVALLAVLQPRLDSTTPCCDHFWHTQSRRPSPSQSKGVREVLPPLHHSLGSGQPAAQRWCLSASGRNVNLRDVHKPSYKLDDVKVLPCSHDACCRARAHPGQWLRAAGAAGEMAARWGRRADSWAAATATGAAALGGVEGWGTRRERVRRAGGGARAKLCGPTGRWQELYIQATCLRNSLLGELCSPYDGVGP